MKTLQKYTGLAGLLCWVLLACQPDSDHYETLKNSSERPQAASVSEALSLTPSQPFERALQPRPFVFPADDGPHPGFETEWWYYTGNLDSPTGQHYGYQLTFFRRALASQSRKGSSAWGTNQLYFAHLALSEIAPKRFTALQRFSRGALGLAGASPQKVWLEDWSAEHTPSGTLLKAFTPEFELKLQLQSTKPEALHGQAGLSQKSGKAGNASYYYSRSRLKTTGQLLQNGKMTELKGLSWLDREWSTSALSAQQLGWDWFSLQLSDGRELMLYQLRLKNGGVDPASSGSLIAKDGQVTRLKASDFQIKVLNTWQSPSTGIVYPSRWQLSLPGQQLKLEVMPWQANQELKLDFIYWEGAVKCQGTGPSGPISGNGYVELTGYEQSDALKTQSRRKSSAPDKNK